MRALILIYLFCGLSVTVAFAVGGPGCRLNKKYSHRPIPIYLHMPIPPDTAASSSPRPWGRPTPRATSSTTSGSATSGGSVYTHLFIASAPSTATLLVLKAHTHPPHFFGFKKITHTHTNSQTQRQGRAGVRPVGAHHGGRQVPEGELQGGRHVQGLCQGKDI